MPLAAKLLPTALCSSMLLAACGGGGGGDGGGDGGGGTTAEALEGPINVSGLTRPTTGNSGTFELEGEISADGRTLDAEGDFDFSVGEEGTFAGETAVPVDQVITLRIPSEGSVRSVGSTLYIKDDGRRIGDEADDGTVCFADSTNSLPVEIEEGDSGDNFQFTCSDGSTETSRWRVKGGDGTLNLQFTFETDTGSRTISEVLTWRFQGDNDVKSLRSEGTLMVNGSQVTFDLDGPAISINFGN